MVPSPKQGEQRAGPPKAKVSSAALAPASGEAKASSEYGMLAGMPTYEVPQPPAPRVAT